MDRVELTNLFDIYESLLTDREKEIFKYYYYEDLSLSEIGENLNITRTGVFNTLKKVEEKLTQFEASLKLMNIKNTLKGLFVKELLNQMEENPENKKIIDQALEIGLEILEK